MIGTRTFTPAQRFEYRNRKLLDLAHSIHECQVQIPDICQGYVAEGCEPAHSNQMEDGHGRGIKAHDCLHAAACPACHAEIDQGKALSREDKLFYWTRGMKRTLLEYWRRGLLGVMK